MGGSVERWVAKKIYRWVAQQRDEWIESGEMGDGVAQQKDGWLSRKMGG